MENKELITGKTLEILAVHGRSPGAVLPVLQEIQKAFNYLPQAALELVCRETEITPAGLTGISTFFSQFRHKPAGLHRIQVCTGTACHVKGALFIYEAFRRELKLEDEEDTDASMIFTLEKVACLGCCTLAPVVRIDDVTYGHVVPVQVPGLLKDFLTRKKRIPETRAGTMADGKNLLGEVRVGLGSCCVASGSEGVKNELDRVLNSSGIPVTVQQVGCIGICNQVPVVEIIKPGEPPVFYAKIKAEEVEEIIRGHFRPPGKIERIRNGIRSSLDRLLADGAPKGFERYTAEERDTPLSRFLGPQVSIATESRGVADPLDLDIYLRSGGFTALRKCLHELTPRQVVEEIISSGLRGRGGAGFPTGRKWRMAHEAPGTEKFVVCNGDEGDPGAFMDRMLLESYPFRIIEGMIMAGYATGAARGIFYIRAEYPLAVSRIREAIKICRTAGYLGPSILGSGFEFDIRIFEGAGAFVCGEETALIASMEGRRGTPALRPPYPVSSGFMKKPTLINNVETFSLVPWILRNGHAAFAAIGTPGSKGTKVFALAGKVKRGGLIEVPMGTTIRQIVFDIGGGIAGDRIFKAVQIGGPSGGCLPASMADEPVDFEALREAGTMMGSGGLIVLDETDCMVDMAFYFLSFTQAQSCGRCTFCRIGTRRMLDILEKLRAGKAVRDDLVYLEHLAGQTAAGSLCGLGKTAPNPVLTTLRYFREEYEAHLEGRCPSGKCLPLVQYRITEKCIGCTLCSQQCPSGAIPFSPYERHTIAIEKCIKCDICRQVCPADAVITG